MPGAQQLHGIHEGTCLGQLLASQLVNAADEPIEAASVSGASSNRSRRFGVGAKRPFDEHRTTEQDHHERVSAAYSQRDQSETAVK